MESCLLVLLVVDCTVQPADVTIPLRNVRTPLGSQLPSVMAAVGLACPGSLLVASQARRERFWSRFEVEFCVSVPLSQDARTWGSC